LSVTPVATEAKAALYPVWAATCAEEPAAVMVPVSDGSIALRPTLEVGAADGVVVLVVLAEQPARARAPTSATAAMLPERVIFTVFPSGMWGFVLVDPERAASDVTNGACPDSKRKVNGR
jgi:hypothetical protein